jgi:hypothetical protein
MKIEDGWEKIRCTTIIIDGACKGHIVPLGAVWGGEAWWWIWCWRTAKG